MEDMKGKIRVFARCRPMSKFFFKTNNHFIYIFKKKIDQKMKDNVLLV